MDAPRLSTVCEIQVSAHCSVVLTFRESGLDDQILGFYRRLLFQTGGVGIRRAGRGGGGAAVGSPGNREAGWGAPKITGPMEASVRRPIS